MQSLSNRRVIVGISGGIAAYKSAELVRELRRANAEVRVVMTDGAKEFITPLTLQALSGNPVHHTLLDPEAEAGMGHIELARWADLVIVAPASANVLARINQGMGNDLLTTIILATKAPLLIAPAMNQAMWSAETSQRNIEQLTATYGQRLTLVGPAVGEQACGDTGPGRMEEPEVIAKAAAAQFESRALAGKHVVITAGPTREALDPVRYLSNHSSGKMGYALAVAARDAGARVSLVSGPVTLECPPQVTRYSVTSACDMLSVCEELSPTADLFIAAAAVADYRPANLSDQKIKKSSSTMTLELVQNPDIVATISSQCRAVLPQAGTSQADASTVIVGFAAETQQLEHYAQSKLERKGLDMIIANDVSRTDIGFNSDDNAVTVFWTDNSGDKCNDSALKRKDIEATSKLLLAHQLIDLITEHNPQLHSTH